MVRSPGTAVSRSLVALWLLLPVAALGQERSSTAAGPPSARTNPELKVSQLSSEWDDWAYSADGSTAGYSGVISGVTQIVDTATGRTIASLPHRGVLAVAEDGASAALGTSQGEVLVWNTGELRPLVPGHRWRISALAMTPDGRWVVSGDQGGIVKLWDASTGRSVWSQELPDKIQSLSLSRDGARVLVCWGSGFNTDQGGSRILEGQTGRPLVDLDRAEGYAIIAGALSGDGSVAVTVRDVAEGLSLWNARTGRRRAVLLTEKFISRLALTEDGTKLAALDGHGLIFLVDVARGELVKTIDTTTSDSFPGTVEKLQFLHQGESLAAAVYGFGAVVLPWSEGVDMIRPFSHSRATPVAIESVVTDASTRFLLAQARRLTALWDLEQGDLLFRAGSEESTKNLARIPLPGAKAEPCHFRSPAITADGSTFAAVSCRETILVFPTSAHSGPREYALAEGHGWSHVGALLFSPSGRYLVAAVDERGERQLLVWDRTTDREQRFPLNAKKVVSLAGFDSTERYLWLVLGRDASWNFYGPDFLLIDLFEETIQQRAHLDNTVCDWASCGEDRTVVSMGGRYAAYHVLGEGQRLMDLEENREVPLAEPDSGGLAFPPAFSCDSRLLLYGNDWGGLNLYELDRHVLLWNRSIREILGFAPRSIRVSFSCRGDRLFVLADQRLFGIPMKPSGELSLPPVEYIAALGEIASFSESATRDTLIAATSIGLSIFDRLEGRLLLTLLALSQGPWVAVSPEGRFDTDDPEALESLSWIMKDDPLHPLPVDIFLRDYFEPRLIPRALGGKPPLPEIPSVAELNRNQPVIGQVNVVPQEGSSELVTVNVEISAVAGSCLREGTRVPCESGVYDLRLYRDGQLVGRSPASSTMPRRDATSPDRRQRLQEWREASVVKDAQQQPITVAGGTRVISFPNIRLPQRADVSTVQLTAYAFNQDRVKSAAGRPAVWSLTGSRAPARRFAYIVTMGVDVTSADWRLAFAPTGARAVGELLAEKLQGGYQTVQVSLFSEYVGDSLEDNATKSKLQAVLKILSGGGTALEREWFPQLKAATPDDLVVIYIASHGYSDPAGNFYVVPSDVGPPVGVSARRLDRCLARAEQSSACDDARRFLAHTISSDELTEWLQDVDAGEMALILDSCHSAAVTGPDFKPGPMGDRGFGQLAYDKRMRVLAATQSDSVAWGTLQLGDRSLLTEALIQQGASEDQTWDLARWLRQAESLVPELHQRYLPREAQRQLPALYDFARQPGAAPAFN